MDYKEKLKKYKEGQLDDDERKALEDEIQKIKELSDFIYELDDEEAAVPEDSTEAGIKKIKGAVNKKFIKTGIITGIVVVVIVCFLGFGLSFLMNKLYYDPSEQVGKYEQSIDVPMTVYSELYNIGNHFSGAVIESEGFGKYTMELNFSGYDDYYDSYKVTLKRGKFDSKLFGKAMEDQYTYTDYFDKTDNVMEDGVEKQIKKDDSVFVSELKNLPETSFVKTAIVLKKDITMSELYKLQKKYDVDFSFAAVRDNKTQSFTSHTGFSPSYFGILPEKNSYNQEKYPCLTGYFEKPDEWENHYKSMLRYLIDNDDFMKAVPDGDYIKKDYEEALNYIEKHGVKAYAAVAYDNPQKLLKIKKDPLVDNINILDVKVSQYAQ